MEALAAKWHFCESIETPESLDSTNLKTNLRKSGLWARLGKLPTQDNKITKTVKRGELSRTLCESCFKVLAGRVVVAVKCLANPLVVPAACFVLWLFLLETEFLPVSHQKSGHKKEVVFLNDRELN